MSSPDAPLWTLVGTTVSDLKTFWKPLLLTDTAYKLVAVILLIPLTTALFRWFLELSGTSFIADADIALFLLQPLGLLTAVVVAGVLIAIVALEQAALMAVVRGGHHGQSVSAQSALAFAAAKAWPVLRLTVRLVLTVLAVAVPFLAVGGGIWLALLSKFDINYYLTDKPREFWIAVSLIGADLAVLLVVLVRVLAGWAFVLPMVIFENRAPGAAIRASRESAAGELWTIGRAIAVWLFVSLALNVLGSTLISRLGHVLIAQNRQSLSVLLVAIGGLLVLWAVVTFVVSLVTTAAFAAMLLFLYDEIARPELTQLPDDAALFPDGLGRWIARLAPKRFATMLVLAMLVSCGVGLGFLQTVALEDRTQVTAHRGASGSAPENSLAAIRRAIEAEADWVEIDVQETADGVVVVAHDSDLKKVAGSSLKIAESTAEQLRQVDIGARFGDEFRGERMPTLAEVLELCRGRAGLNIELKYYGPTQRLERRVVELVEDYDMQDQVVIMSLKLEGVRKIRQLRPDWTIGLLTAAKLGDLTKVDVDFLAVSTRLASRKFIRTAHRRGKDVFVWTVDDPLTMSAMIGRGVDNLITDHPAEARRVLARRAELTPIERWLLELAVLLGREPLQGAVDRP